MQKIVSSLVILTSCFTLVSCCGLQKKQIAKADSDKHIGKCTCGTNCACTSGQNEQCNCGISCKEASKK